MRATYTVNLLLIILIILTVLREYY